MSSIFGHALMGAAIGDNADAKTKTEKIFLCLFFVSLSICLDLDYLPTWFFGLQMEPRYSHSIAGCVVVSLIGLLLKWGVFTHLLRSASLALIAAAPLSHVLLDFFVGVHKNPILWPLSDGLYAFDYGILPSAGRLKVDNYYFWRNLTIEMGMLIPIAIAVSATARNIARKNMIIIFVAMLTLLFFGYVGFGLQR